MGYRKLAASLVIEKCQETLAMLFLREVEGGTCLAHEIGVAAVGSHGSVDVATECEVSQRHTIPPDADCGSMGVSGPDSSKPGETILPQLS